MTDTTANLFGAMPGLPDPERDPQFYEGVASRRLAAWIVDLIVILTLGVPLALVFGVATLGFGFVLFPVVLMSVGLVYRTLTIAGASATWGMRLMGIELRRGDGSRFDFVAALAHTAIYTISFSVVLVQIASMIGMITTRYGQGLSDIVLRSAMINRPAD